MLGTDVLGCARRGALLWIIRIAGRRSSEAKGEVRASHWELSDECAYVRYEAVSSCGKTTADEKRKATDLGITTEYIAYQACRSWEAASGHLSGSGERNEMESVVKLLDDLGIQKEWVVSLSTKYE